MEPTTCLVIPADLDEIPKISAVIEEVMQTQEYSREAILDMQLAVEESVVNTILHGYCGTAGEVVISVYATTDSIAVRIEDRAPPFDPLSLPDPDFGSDLAERRVGGLGVYLMQHVVDEIRYEYVDGKNILTLVKKKMT